MPQSLLMSHYRENFLNLEMNGHECDSSNTMRIAQYLSYLLYPTNNKLIYYLRPT